MNMRHWSIKWLLMLMVAAMVAIIRLRPRNLRMRESYGLTMHG